MLLDCLGAEWVYLLPKKTADGKIVDENGLKPVVCKLRVEAALASFLRRQSIDTVRDRLAFAEGSR